MEQTRLYLVVTIVVAILSFCIGYAFHKKPISGFIIPPESTPAILLPSSAVEIEPTTFRYPSQPARTEESMLKCLAGTVKVCEAGVCDCQQATY